MKSFVCALLVAQAVLQITNAQCIRTVAGPLINSYVSSCGGPATCPCSGPIINPCCSPCASPMIASPAIIQSNSVAASLADTLSLLTVSSLLADTLPLGPNVLPVPVSGCGCGLGGCGCGMGGCGCGMGCCGCGLGDLGGCGCGGLGYGGYYY